MSTSEELATKRVASGVGEGGMAIAFAHRWLQRDGAARVR